MIEPEPQAVAPDARVRSAPRFYVTPRQRFSLGALVLAFVIALGCLCVALYVLSHSRHRQMLADGLGWHAGASGDADDDDDDPSRVDTIYLGGPDEAPVATRPGAKARAVHPFVVVKLPSGGDQSGQIPDSAAGRLLYGWLAAFNARDPAAAGGALDTVPGTAAAQVELRRETGGFTLLSAKEIAPGLLVFRLHDQTVAENQVLGTLQVRPGVSPAVIGSFSLREVPSVKAGGR